MATHTSLFEVYLRLRPGNQDVVPDTQPTKKWLSVEQPLSPASGQGEQNDSSIASHINLQPPDGSRKRAVERFGFTRVFEGDSSQLDIFESIGGPNLIRNVVSDRNDSLIATLGVSGSGKVKYPRSKKAYLLTSERLIQSWDRAPNVD